LKLEKKTKEELIKVLLPLVKERNTLGCFGGTCTGTSVICQCSGPNQNEHMRKQMRKMKLEEKILKIVKNKIGKEVRLMPGTYTDVAIILKDSGKPIKNGYSFEGVLTLDSEGEVREERVWA